MDIQFVSMEKYSQKQEEAFGFQIHSKQGVCYNPNKWTIKLLHLDLHQLLVLTKSLSHH
jgi:hypothetical protein